MALNQKSLLACVGMLLLSTVCLADGNSTLPTDQFKYDPGVLLNQRIKELQRLRMDIDAVKGFENQEEEKTESVETVKPDAPEVTLKLNRLEIPDSAVLKRADLDAIVEKYSGREVQVADLYDAVEEINKLYQRGGYITTRAILPPQKIEDGIVKIQLIEGIVGNVFVDGNKYTKESYIKKRMGIQVGKVPNMNTLKNRIQNFNGTSNTVLQIKMVAGEAPLTTDFYIVAVEPKSKNFTSIFTDNSGSENSGKWRYGLNYSDINLSGIGDTLSASFMVSQTSETGMVSYSRPINNNGTELGLSYSGNHMRVSHGYMKPLDVRGKSSTWGFSLSHPTKMRAKIREQIIFEFQRQRSRTTIQGGTFVDDKEQRFSLGYSSLRIKPNQIFYWKPAVTYNAYDGLYEKKYGARFVIDGLWRKFQKKGDIISLRLNTQKAFSDYIPSADQYYLGGQFTVRGYEANGIGADSGINVKLDYAWHTRAKGLMFITFADWGRLFGESILSTKQIYSLGWGFEYQHKNIVASLYVGYALKRHIGDNKVDANNTHFSLNYIF